ncbi:hypothetical protein AB1Y20_017790 [Prymnesium parvum]|uniref:PI-PLC Y-box domain-containing protein n=1 Tax=Prymnesium parvum TaxID=97485 RepID=A0AB34JN45_PRYPA
MAGNAAGFALTFDGFGTDIASTQLPGHIFRGATGLTMTVWCRAFGLKAAPFRSWALTMTTPKSSTFFQPISWRDAGASWGSTVFDSTNVVNGDPRLHINEFHRWRHVAVAWGSAGGSLEVYLDGQLVLNKTGVHQGYNLTQNTAAGVHLGVGVYAFNPTSHVPAESFRGSLDHLQLWMRRLDVEQIRSDFRTYGRNLSFAQPALRYSFDEGAGSLAANSGSAQQVDLLLGSSPDGWRFFTAGSTSTHQYTSPVWAPSDLPGSNRVPGDAPIVHMFRPGSMSNLSLVASTTSVRITSQPAQGELRFGGDRLYVGAHVPTDAVITYDATNATERSSFSFLAVDQNESAIANGTVHLVAEGLPLVVQDPPGCSWPLGHLRCEEVNREVSTREDTPVTIFLVGRSPHGSDRTTAVISRTPDHGTLYQLSPCCDPANRGDIIEEGHEVLDGSSAVVFVPSQDSFGVGLVNLSFYVRDASGATSEPATLTITVVVVEDAPLLETVVENSTSPLTPIFLPLQASDAEGDVVTLTMSRGPAHGSVFIATQDGTLVRLAQFNGGLESGAVILQQAVDVLDVSSFWLSTWRFHPLQILGEQDIFEYGDSVYSWSPRFRNGDSLGEYESGGDEAPVTIHNVTKAMSYRYNPSLTFDKFGYTEFIELKFERPVFPTGVRIGENRGMCSVVLIQGRNSATPNSSFVDLWASGETPESRAACWNEYDLAKRYRIFSPSICEHQGQVDILRLQLDTRSIDDWNEIDFVELLGTQTLKDGVLPADTTGVWYVPDPGFVGEDSIYIIGYDCAFNNDRASKPLHVPIFVSGDFPPPSPPARVIVSEVRIGLLLPMFETEAAGYSNVVWSPRVGAYQALREINNKSDGIADDLLPETQLLFVYRDSKCDSVQSLAMVLEQTQDAFGGAGVSAIVGAGCSSASVMAAQVAQGSQVPIISPSSTSPSLSDSNAYPFFLRTIPSDSFSVVAMVDLLLHLWKYSSVAVVHSTDAYGTGAASAFSEVALSSGISVVTTQSFAKDSPSFWAQQRALLQSGSRVILLFSPTSDAGRFLRTALSVGVGGPGYLWLGTDSLADAGLWEGDPYLATNATLRDEVLTGIFCLRPALLSHATDRYSDYLLRRQKLPKNHGDVGSCNLETDDTGVYLWAQDHDDNQSTPLACSGFDLSRDGPYDAFAYDAVFAIAHAVHDLLTVQNVTKIVGIELLNTLLEKVHFDGVTGPLSFYEGNANLLYRGDRRDGVTYEIFNYVGRMRYKLKVMVSAYQCIAAVPTVFDLRAPPGLEEYTRWMQALELPSRLGVDLVIPSACFGSYRTRLLVSSSWPLVLIGVLALGFVSIELRRNSINTWRDAFAGLRRGLEKTLPPTLSITFLLVPSTATRIFKTFLCDRYEYNEGEVRRYVQDDLSLSCDSDEYASTWRTAFAMLLIWPVGVPILYAWLLWAFKEPLAIQRSDSLKRAVEFLAGDYKPGAFWWEPLEMCRKLTLTGWLLLISEELEQARVLWALLSTISFLSFFLVFRPVRRGEGSFLMVIVQLSLVLVYTCVLVIKSCDGSSLTSQRDSATATLRASCRTFGFGDTADGDLSDAMQCVPPNTPLPILSVNERRLLDMLGLSRVDQYLIEGLQVQDIPSAISGDHVMLSEDQLSTRTSARLAADPPPQVGHLQRLTARWLMRPYPHGLRFSGKNMNPLPGWLVGAQSVTLNMCQNDLPVQLHHALFYGSGGYVLKPQEMLTHTMASPAESMDMQSYWPQLRERYHRTTVEVLSLHNLPKVRLGVCHVPLETFNLRLRLL